jgi:hypothetical protein
MTLGALLVLSVWVSTAAAGVYVGRPALSRAPTLGVTFTVSGVTTPTAKDGVTTVVKIKVLAPNASGAYVTKQTLKAKLVRRSGKPGYRYSRSVKIGVVGPCAFRAFRYANGRLVGRSAIKEALVTYGSGLLAHWPFDETEGTIAADAVGDADGGLEGPPSWSAGKVGGGLGFDGDDGVRVTAVSALQSATVTYAAWVYPTAFPNAAYNEVISFMRDNGCCRASVALFCDGGAKPGVSFQNGTSITASLASPMAIPLERWSFLAVSYDGAVIRLFVNGVLKGRMDFAGGIDYGAGPGQIHIGGDLYGFPAFFSGRIDEPAVLSRALK